MRKKKICLLLVLMMFVAVLGIGCKSDYEAKFSKNVSSYDLDISVDEQNKTASIKQKVDYYNSTGTSLNEIYFHTYPNAFSETSVNKPVSSVYQDKAYYNGFSEGKIEISSVKQNEKEIEYDYKDNDKTLIAIKLLDKVDNKKVVSIYFEYTLLIPNVNHRFGYGENTINMGNFYPIASVYENGAFNENGYHYNGDPFYSDVSNYNVKITHSSEYQCVATGNETNSQLENNKTVDSYSALAVRDFCFVLSTKFNKMTDKVGNTTINYYYYNDTNQEQSLKTSSLALSTFNNMFGKYPYKVLNVVESNFVHGGMEYPELVLISDDLDTYEDYTETIVHEIAHQWWYGLVGNDEFDSGYLDEGLAELSTALFFGANPSYNITYDSIIENAESSYSLFIDVYTDVFGNVTTTMNRKLSEYKTEPEYVYMAYVKGMLMYDNLRQVMGEKKFEKALKYYFETNKGKNVKLEDMIKCFNKTARTDLTSFFDSWVNGKVVIEKH